MTSIDDFKAEYARQHPQRPEKELWNDEILAIAPIIDALKKELAGLHRENFELRRTMFGLKYSNCDE